MDHCYVFHLNWISSVQRLRTVKQAFRELFFQCFLTALFLAVDLGIGTLIRVAAGSLETSPMSMMYYSIMGRA